MTPAFYYDLIITVNDQIDYTIGTLYPVWLIEQDYKTEWVNQGKLLKDYYKDSDDLFESKQYYEDKMVKFKQDCIQKSQQRVRQKYNLVLYKNGKWINTVVSTTINLKSTRSEEENMLKNIHELTEDVYLKEIVESLLSLNDVKTITLKAVTYTSRFKKL